MFLSPVPSKKELDQTILRVEKDNLDAKDELEAKKHLASFQYSAGEVPSLS